jgi:ELWxxDGT repeat protein
MKDIWPGGSPEPASSLPDSLTDVGGTLYFSAEDGIHGRELWRSDGTEAGTLIVKDLVPGALGSSPWNPTDVGGTLYFTAYDDKHGRELWRSNGTGAGTAMVKDIWPGGGFDESSNPSQLTDMGGTLYFVADDGTHGSELWRTDGTEAGTVMVTDLYRGKQGSAPMAITDFGGTVFFSAVTQTTGRELWRVQAG